MIYKSTCYGTMELSLNLFTEFGEFSDKSKRVGTCYPATSCVRDQDATTAPPRHMWETGSLNGTQFMLQIPQIRWIRWKFCSFRKNPNDLIYRCGCCFSYLHVTGDTYGRPIHGQKEVSGYPSPSELNYWKAAEGIFIKPSDPLPRVGGVHDEL